ncbi:hypothetical protein EKO04_006462 [Ascochyta lentis]|uniref:LysM domain-containing protein n=1 Tax=Ascochyta lentis TaxID=205686 RepID=A0A8H7J327_9PLEO|nr:hypothetical protein EKO04_006462 [Ascochyta lentis]
MAFAITTWTQLPLAPGTVPGCYQYRNYFARPIPVIVDQEVIDVIDVKASPTDQLRNDCRWVARKHGLSLEYLLQWNPSLKSGDCELQPGYSYCVLRTKGAEDWTTLWQDLCVPKEALQFAEVMDGTDPNCDCFAKVTGDDTMYKNPSTCSHLAKEAGVPVGNIAKYNSWINKADCDASLYAGLGVDSSRAVCVSTLDLPSKTDVVPSSTSFKPPICTFDPNKGEYVCPDLPSCTFNPEKGEYVCSKIVATGSTQQEETEEVTEL